MERALVVYESVFGNTRSVAEAVADGLASLVPVETREVRDAPAVLDPDVDLLVVGAPTHAFGLPRNSTRADAAKHGEGPGVGAETGMREWLAALTAPRGMSAAVFCTVADKPRWIHVIGTAGRAMEAGLSGLGLSLVAPAERFHVAGMTGPLTAGELERARAWGAELGRRLLHRAPTLRPTQVAGI